jgi:hypothetical protein
MKNILNIQIQCEDIHKSGVLAEGGIVSPSAIHPITKAAAALDA